MTKKDKMQLMALGGIIVVVLVVVVINYRDRFLPKPDGDVQEFAAPARLEAAVKLDTGILERADYLALRSYGSIEVVAPDMDKVSQMLEGMVASPLADDEAGGTGESLEDLFGPSF